jgi:hypothetical protein
VSAGLWLTSRLYFKKPVDFWLEVAAFSTKVGRREDGMSITFNSQLFCPLKTWAFRQP